MRTITTILLCTLLALPLASCAAALPFIPMVATVVSEIASVLDGIESQVEQAPAGIDTSKVLSALKTARKALTVVQSAANAGEGIASKDYVAAVDALMDAYAAVLDLARDFGVMAAAPPERAKLGAAPGKLLVPGSAELRARLLSGERP